MASVVSLDQVLFSTGKEKVICAEGPAVHLDLGVPQLPSAHSWPCAVTGLGPVSQASRRLPHSRVGSSLEADCRLLGAPFFPFSLSHETFDLAEGPSPLPRGRDRALAGTAVSRRDRPGPWPLLLRGQSCLRRPRDLSRLWVLVGVDGGGDPGEPHGGLATSEGSAGDGGLPVTAETPLGLRAGLSHSPGQHEAWLGGCSRKFCGSCLWLGVSRCAGHKSLALRQWTLSGGGSEWLLGPRA